MGRPLKEKKEKYDNLGYIIKYLRETKRIRQIDIVSKYGFNASVLTKIERNDRAVSIEELNKYAQAFDMPVEEIINFKIPKITYNKVLHTAEEHTLRERGAKAITKEKEEKSSPLSSDTKLNIVRIGEKVIITIECSPAVAKGYIKKLDLL